MNKFYAIAAISITMWGCNNSGDGIDASGLFEAEEVIISSEVAGTVEALEIDEGQHLKAGQQIGYIDSTQLYLKKQQLQSQIEAVLSKRPDVAVQVAALQEQLKALKKDRDRIANLVKADAATQKQLDDINAQVEVIEKQIKAQQNVLGKASNSISMETNPMKIQIEEIADQLRKCRIVNPLNGTVLAQYTREKEMVAPGKPLYKIADISSLLLRAYVTGDQLSEIKLGQQVTVQVDDGAEEYKQYNGTIVWISDKAEFTPKTIQTKDERANLVYAMKVKVKNDGFLKIGMYGEVKLSPEKAS